VAASRRAAAPVATDLRATRSCDGPTWRVSQRSRDGALRLASWTASLQYPEDFLVGGRWNWWARDSDPLARWLGASYLIRRGGP